jgi:hypothetical protein
MGLSKKLQELLSISARRVVMIGLIWMLSSSGCQSTFVTSSFLVAQPSAIPITTTTTTTTTTATHQTTITKTKTIRKGRAPIVSVQRHPGPPPSHLAAETNGATTTTTTTSIGDATTNSKLQKKKNLWSVEECLLAYHNNNNNQKSDSGLETKIHFVDSSWYHKGSRNGRDEYVTTIME